MYKLPPLLSICSISTKLLAIIMRIQAIIPSFGIIAYTFHSAVKTTSLGFMLRGRRERVEQESGERRRDRLKCLCCTDKDTEKQTH